MTENTLISTKEELSQIISENNFVLVDFWAEWCMPCRMMGEVLEQLSDIYGDEIKIIKINVEENEELASFYEIKNLPTIIIFKDGEILLREVGLKQVNFFKQIIEKNR